MVFYKPTCGRSVYVPVKTEDEVKIPLQIINSFGFIVVILIRNTGSSRTVTLWESLFYSFNSLAAPCTILWSPAVVLRVYLN